MKADLRPVMDTEGKEARPPTLFTLRCSVYPEKTHPRLWPYSKPARASELCGVEQRAAGSGAPTGPEDRGIAEPTAGSHALESYRHCRARAWGHSEPGGTPPAL